MPPSILKNHSASQIVEGKRVYITGFIGYKEIRNEEGYTLKTAQINANKILLCAENEDVASGKCANFGQFIALRGFSIHFNEYLLFQMSMM